MLSEHPAHQFRIDQGGGFAEGQNPTLDQSVGLAVHAISIRLSGDKAVGRGGFTLTVDDFFEAW